MEQAFVCGQCGSNGPFVDVHDPSGTAKRCTQCDTSWYVPAKGESFRIGPKPSSYIFGNIITGGIGEILPKHSLEEYATATFVGNVPAKGLAQVAADLTTLYVKEKVEEANNKMPMLVKGANIHGVGPDVGVGLNPNYVPDPPPTVGKTETITVHPDQLLSPIALANNPGLYPTVDGGFLTSTEVTSKDTFQFTGYFKELWDKQAQWSQATFGSDESRGPVGPLRHLAKEVREMRRNTRDEEEYADGLLLLIDAYRRAFKGHKGPQDLIFAAMAKLEKNRLRKWPSSKDPNAAVEHVRGEDEVGPLLRGSGPDGRRRNDLLQLVDSELAIRDAVEAVEAVGAHPMLTYVVVELGRLNDVLADYLEGTYSDPMQQKQMEKDRETKPLHAKIEALEDDILTLHEANKLKAGEVGRLEKDVEAQREQIDNQAEHISRLESEARTNGQLAANWKTTAEDKARELEEVEAWKKVDVESNKALDQFLRQLHPGLPEHYGMPIDGLRMTLAHLGVTGYSPAGTVSINVQTDSPGDFQAAVADTKANIRTPEQVSRDAQWEGAWRASEAKAYFGDYGGFIPLVPEGLDKAIKLLISRVKEELVGKLPEGVHPDEANPRDKTWLGERVNWETEVRNLRTALSQYQRDLTAVRELATTYRADFQTKAKQLDVAESHLKILRECLETIGNLCRESADEQRKQLRDFINQPTLPLHGDKGL